MKVSVTAILVLFSIIANAQIVTITFKSGERKTLTTSAHTATVLFTPEGPIKYTDIDSLSFHGYEQAYEGLRKHLLENRIKVIIAEPIDIQDSGHIAVSPLITQPQRSSTGPAGAIQMEKFLNQRTGGKLLQLAGFVALGVASYIALNPPENGNYDEIQKGLPWVGLGSVGIGLVIDIDASRHLRVKTKH